MQSGIYAIIGPNGKYYIGQSVSLRMRWYHHRYRLRKQTHTCRHLQAAYNKYGEANFKFEILEKCSVELLTVREQYHMDLRIGKLYNTAPAASTNAGIKRSQEYVEKLRQRKRLPISEETRKHMQENTACSIQVTLSDGTQFISRAEFARACGYRHRNCIRNAVERGQTYDQIAARRKKWLKTYLNL